MKALLRALVTVCMLTALLTIAPAPASARLVEAGSTGMPEGLQEAILEGTAQPFRETAGRYHASSGGLDFELDAHGLQAGADGMAWSIALGAFGRAAQMTDVSAADIAQAGGRLEYRRGGITEWYRDTALGVEQGFTIMESPAGKGQLVLHINVQTGMQAVLDGDGYGLSFLGDEGKTLRYDNLMVFDASGQHLQAEMDYSPGLIHIRVNDRGANYPVTIDPLIHLEQKVIATDGAAIDYFGVSVALSGDTALVGADFDDVGANSNQGSAYVFVRDGTTWTQQAQLTALDGAVDDGFGRSVALSDDTALVGAYTDDVGANAYQGSAYVFVPVGATWNQQAKLTASDGAAGDYFGGSVALSGDTALVGAYTDDVGVNTNQGSAYVFVRNGTTWNQQAQLTASDGTANDSFGYSVALSGDTALVGAQTDDVGANTDQGSAYVFVRDGTIWTQQVQLTAPDGAAYDRFGYSAALSGDTALVGAVLDDMGANPDQGSAYVFTRSGTTWSQQTRLTASDGAANDYFGGSVALSGDTALVGAYSDNVGVNTNQGSAYVFVRNGTTWGEHAKLTASDGAAFDYFGYSVALSGDTALVGAYYDDVGSNTDQGSAYFYKSYPMDADLAVSAARGASSPLHPGETVLLTASVVNNGPHAASAVQLDVALPTGLTYVSHVVTHGAYTPATGSWAVGSLPVMVSATLVITASVDAISSQTLVFNPYSPASDINNANNSASLLLPVYTLHEIARNGGFNIYIGTSRIPQYWVAKNFAALDGKNTTVKREGTASVMIRNTTAVLKILTQTLTLAGNAGDEFSLSFWVRGISIPVGGACRVQVMLYNGTTLVSSKAVNCSSGTYAFQQKKLNFTSPGDYTKVIVRWIYAKAGGTIWLDRLSLMKAP